MRRPATALIAVTCFLLLSCSTLFASDVSLIRFAASSVSTISSSVENSFQSVSSAYNSWTASNRAALPELAAQWDHYTGEFGAAGAPLFVIGQVANPVITGITGIQPGSSEAQQAGRAIVEGAGGVVNVPMKIIWGRDLNNPDKHIAVEDRISSITAMEAATYGIVVGAPLIGAAAGYATAEIVNLCGGTPALVSSVSTAMNYIAANKSLTAGAVVTLLAFADTGHYIIYGDTTPPHERRSH